MQSLSNGLIGAAVVLAAAAGVWAEMPASGPGRSVKRGPVHAMPAVRPKAAKMTIKPVKAPKAQTATHAAEPVYSPAGRVVPHGRAAGPRRSSK